MLDNETERDIQPVALGSHILKFVDQIEEAEQHEQGGEYQQDTAHDLARG
jgi:hypothetical protein